MHFHHPPAKKFKLQLQDESPMETIVLHLSPYGIGHMGGEMAKRMVDAAQGYLQEVTARELRKAFRQQIYQDNDLAKDSHHSLNGQKVPFISGLSQSGDEVHANQYPSENGTH